jgi:hypothetical protein
MKRIWVITLCLLLFLIAITTADESAPVPVVTYTQNITTVTDIDVIIGGEMIAIIPDNSKFNGMGVHEDCLIFQYGTDNWYTCEKGWV